jgi:hypothetical protein
MEAASIIESPDWNQWRGKITQQMNDQSDMLRSIYKAENDTHQDIQLAMEKHEGKDDKRFGEITTSLESLRKQVQEVLQKISYGRGFLAGIAVFGGIVGSVITYLIIKFFESR